MKAGMEVFADAGHLPVLCLEAIDALNIREGGCYVDGTFGVVVTHLRFYQEPIVAFFLLTVILQRLPERKI